MTKAEITHKLVDALRGELLFRDDKLAQAALVKDVDKTTYEALVQSARYCRSFCNGIVKAGKMLGVNIHVDYAPWEDKTPRERITVL